MTVVVDVPSDGRPLEDVVLLVEDALYTAGADNVDVTVDEED